MATGIVLTVAQTLLCALASKELRELCSIFGYESHLAELERTVETIKAVLLDAESKHQDLNNQGKDWLGKLKDAVYDADDLFDEFNTIAQQQKRVPGGKISKKVHRFFSSDNQLLFAAKTSRKIKKLRKRLDSIAKDRTQFGFSDVYVPVKRREETSSYVYESSIIGREADKENVLGLLFGDLDVEDNVSFMSIVGIGGLGKTALAQLVFQDDKIKVEFEMRLWVCVSEEFGMKEILSKMVGKSEVNVEELQREVRRKIEGKKYFLVLDDVWNENRNEWAKVWDFLLLGARGSRIIVTTRSKRVARAIGDYPIYELKGLSDEDSWCLFERMAFNQGSRHVDDAIVDIGKDIVKKCANVPLSIRIIGSMLYDQDKSKWVLFQKLNLAEMGQGEDGIMPILKFSYYHLTPQLKSCFSYCALLPKDSVIKKSLLINLWLAQGCLECSNDMQNIEDVGDEYFFILLHRCFFHDIERDVYGDIYSIKMHDLIHDLAQEVAGKESCLVMDASTSHFDEKIRHMSFVIGRLNLVYSTDTLSKMSAMRTILRLDTNADWDSNKVGINVANCRRLRVLDLHNFSIRSLCNQLDHLSHLRYLDLSYNSELRMLPKSISKLHNLQVLNLNHCRDLKELPEDLRELVNLRHLDTTDCDALTHMPLGMGNMIGLSRLTMFVLGGGSSNEVQTDDLRNLMPLINLRDELTIKFRKGYSYDTISAENHGYLSNHKYIKALNITGRVPHRIEVFVNERLLKCLEPHCDLRKIRIAGYKGIRLARWAETLATSLPQLVVIDLSCFYELEHLPKLSQLHHLKILHLEDMSNVEYMEDEHSDTMLPFYPSLEELRLIDFPKLKGWWREEGVIPAFSGVLKLEIEKCPNLTSFPGCPYVKQCRLEKFNEQLTFCGKRDPTDASSLSEISFNKSGHLIYYLDELTVDDLEPLNTLFGEPFRGFCGLTINQCWVESLSSVAEWNLKQALSIKNLCFSKCHNLKSLSGGNIEHMTNLHSLSLEHCNNLDLEEDQHGMPWIAFHNLSSLTIYSIQKVINLPKGIQYLSSLRHLSIYNCQNLEALPEWLHCLTSLTSLRLLGCPKLRSLPQAICRLPSLTQLTIGLCDGLRERCREPDGEDYPIIRNIAHLDLEWL